MAFFLVGFDCNERRIGYIETQGIVYYVRFSCLLCVVLVLNQFSLENGICSLLYSHTLAAMQTTENTSFPIFIHCTDITNWLH